MPSNCAAELAGAVLDAERVLDALGLVPERRGPAATPFRFELCFELCFELGFELGFEFGFEFAVAFAFAFGIGSPLSTRLGSANRYRCRMS